MEDLTCKIRKSLADEVEESVSKQVHEEAGAQVNNKVQQNLTLTWALKITCEGKSRHQNEHGGYFFQPLRVMITMVQL